MPFLDDDVMRLDDSRPLRRVRGCGSPTSDVVVQTHLSLLNRVRSTYDANRVGSRAIIDKEEHLKKVSVSCQLPMM